MYNASEMVAYTTLSGLKRYRLPVTCAEMNKCRSISSDTPEFAIHKATLQEYLWSEQWKERGALKHKKLGLEMNAKRSDLKERQKHKIAEGRTEIAQRELVCAYRVLSKGLEATLDHDWEFFKKYPPYSFPKPDAPEFPSPPPRPVSPREPASTDPEFQPKLETMDKLLHARRVQKEQEAHTRFEAAHSKWERLNFQMRQVYQQQISQYKDRVESLKNQYQQQLAAWEQGKTAYIRARETCVRLVEQKKAAYLEHEPHAVLDFFDMALARSQYPSCFPHSFEMDYDFKSRTLLIEYLLPPLRKLPRLARVVYDEGERTFHDIILADNERNVLYAQLLHELPLRTFHELFSVDIAVSLAAIRFFGYIFLEENKEPGKLPARVVEVQADRATFAALDLYHGNPAVIFEEMGGVIRSHE